MILQFETETTISHSVENSLRKRLWTCRRADCGMKQPPDHLKSIFNTAIGKKSPGIVRGGMGLAM